ncbi:hypothetical protein AVEN_175755-1 [Araneus ventricosus]|uniref:Uncharacterized protein n=1 Tax=Araneus ventricosus TaxID=182803 RepID=A0A4Y2W1J0_ARAVE|nr:hypothetical protein AVEN_227418-1 [Araneus ventricosus]GBO30419.1 hypothetical protein AVEN_142626-1 [Araneus ventricosus]GBO30420.1 hypothetical protein AVEN_262614-1 [Araneus ventricosus]GBO30429.1 hypothetical protein AVEN_175755-1 [Araneus ventricosus]
MSKKVKDNFLHVFSGCESTPAIFRQRKMKFAKLLDKDAEKQRATEVLKNNHGVVTTWGEKIISTLYAGSSLQSYSRNETRLTTFTKSLVLQSNFSLDTLPPTEETARVYS